MPSYDYECTICGHRFEAFQLMSEPPLTDCPQCGKRVRRLIGGGTGIIFKGSGFYVTDNRKSSSNGNGSKSTGKKEESSTSAKTESPSTKEGAKEKVAV